MTTATKKLNLHEFQLKLFKQLCRCTDDAERSLNLCGDEEPPTKIPKHDPSTRMQSGFTSLTLTQFPATPTRNFLKNGVGSARRKEGGGRDTHTYCQECNVPLRAYKC